MAQDNEWGHVWGSSPRTATHGNKKHLGDYLDESGRYWSTPSTPTGRTQLGRESSFDIALNSQEKPKIMTKVHDKAKRWKQILPKLKKHLHGPGHGNDERQGVEIDKSKSATTSAGPEDDGNMEEQDAEYHGGPSDKLFSNSSYYPRKLYESEIAPKLYKQHSMQQGSAMDSPPRLDQSQSRLTMSPPQLTRCKSYRPRPGVKSKLEEVKVHDMVRTKSDPLQLKPIRLNSSEYEPTSFSFPTSPEIEELNDHDQEKFKNHKLDITKYPSSLSPRLISNMHYKPQSSETRLSSSSTSKMIGRNNNDDTPFTDYNIIVEEINEILDSPTTRMTPDLTGIQSAQNHHQPSLQMYQAIPFSGLSELNMHTKLETLRPIFADMWNNDMISMPNANESPTYKVLSEVAHNITDYRVAANQELELDATNDHLTISVEPTDTDSKISMTGIQVFSDEQDNNTSEHHGTTTFNDSEIVTGVVSEMVTQFNAIISGANEQVIESSQISTKPQPQEFNSTTLELEKPINLKPISTKLTKNHPKDSGNPTNQDDYKTVTEAVTEILTPAYHAVSEAATKLVESARMGTIKVAQNISINNSNSNIGASDGGDYKTVTEAVGEMLSPVYSAVSQATNKVAGTGYQSGISLRDYLKSKAVVGNTRTEDYSLVENENMPGSPVPVSRNPHTEEIENTDASGRKLQEYTN